MLKILVTFSTKIRPSTSMTSKTDVFDELIKAVFDELIKAVFILVDENNRTYLLS